jgi:hypothetical protein
MLLGRLISHYINEARHWQRQQLTILLPFLQMLSGQQPEQHSQCCAVILVNGISNIFVTFQPL